MITRAEARREVWAELRKRNFSKRMTPVELLQFCQEMYERLEFRTRGDRLSDIRNWAEAWQAQWLR